MKNFGFVSKKKVAKEIAKIYNSHQNVPCGKEQFLQDCAIQSALNFLCAKLDISPMHLNSLASGTNEMIKQRED